MTLTQANLIGGGETHAGIVLKRAALSTTTSHKSVISESFTPLLGLSLREEEGTVVA